MPTRAAESGGVDGVNEGDPTFVTRKRVVLKDVGEDGEKGWSFKNSFVNPTTSCSDGSSSSIGRNSDASENSMEKSGDGDEVQSSFKCPFDDAMKALEEVLPIRRGISRFYNGKSKSFANLEEAFSASSAKELAKPDYAFMRRRRRYRSSCLRSISNGGGGISKRVSRSMQPNEIYASSARSRPLFTSTSLSLPHLQQRRLSESDGTSRNEDEMVIKP